jgi:undecaprenyl-phosphate 4-deoxy-4-formamido-L-arabinose transferase
MQLSVVVPVYKSAKSLPELARQVRQYAAGKFESYELILVNDGSPDTSWEVIARLANEYHFITGVNLRRNVGQDNAIMAGLHHTCGEVVVIMDDDLQHDPSDIPLLCHEIQKGFDVVYANFEKKEQALWKNLGSWFNDRVAMLVLDKPKQIYMSPYKAIRREVVEEIIKYDGPFSYVDGLIFTITSNITQINATHHSRFAGRSNYNLLKSLQVWLKLATGFSVVPLRMATFLGGIISLFSFVMASFFVLQALLLERVPEGWPSLIVAVFFLGGVQLIGIGAVGEYIGRIFITQNKRPQFTIKEICRSAGKSQMHDIGVYSPTLSVAGKIETGVGGTDIDTMGWCNEPA